MSTLTQGEMEVLHFACALAMESKTVQELADEKPEWKAFVDRLDGLWFSMNVDGDADPVYKPKP